MEAIEQFVSENFAEFPYLKFTIGTILINSLIEFYVDLRQRSRLQETSMPAAVKALTTQEQFEENNAYAFDKMNFGLIRQLYGLIKGLSFLYFFFYPAVWKFTDDTLTQYGYGYNTHPILCQLAYSAVTEIFDSVISIPWGLYADFVLEEKWGFNKKTMWIFFTDIIRDVFIVGLPLNSILMAIILGIVSKAGDYWFIWAWAFVCVFIFIMMWIYPNYIQPCYNKVEELETGDSKEGQTRAAIEQLAQRIDYPLKKLYKIDGSKRSGHSNAYMYGFCSNKRIVLFDTLMEQMNIEEITAVLGHELGHWSHSHTIFMLVKMQVTIFIGFFVVGFFLKEDRMYREFGFDARIPLIGINLAQYLFGPLGAISKFLNNWHTRVMEYQADRFAVNLGYGDSLKSGLLILVGKNKKEMNPDWLFEMYNFSHPGIVARISGINAAMAKEKKTK